MLTGDTFPVSQGALSLEEVQPTLHRVVSEVVSTGYSFSVVSHFVRHTVPFSVVGHTHVACGYPASGHARVAGAVKVYKTNRSVVSD
jgi:hypothetical protein